MANGSNLTQRRDCDMTHSQPRWLRAVRALCSHELWTRVAEPGLADLAYDRKVFPGNDYARVCIGYWRIVLAIALALPADAWTHHRPTAGTLVRIVVAVAFPGLTPSFGFSDSSPSRGHRTEISTNER